MKLKFKKQTYQTIAMGAEAECFVKITSDQVKYDVVDGYAKLMELVAP